MKNIIIIIIVLFAFAKMSIGQCNMDRHNTNAFDGWVSCTMAPNPNAANGNSHWILYDLGENKNLYTSQFWNINHPSHLDWGIRTIRVEHSLDNANWTSLGDFTFPQAPGQSIYEGFEGPDFEAVTARYILLTAINNYGGSCSGFGELKIFTQDEQLPAGLVTFTGKEVDCEIKLEWRTATEENVERFEVQKSKDGITYKTIAEVNAVGNSTSPINYRHIDPSPYSANYYRLKTVDRDGMHEYSNTVSVNSYCYEDGVVEIFPNPVTASELLTIRFHSNETAKVTMEVIDALGRVVDRMDLSLTEGVNNVYYEAADLPAGMYSLKFTGATWLSEVQKFMKAD